MTPKDLQSRQLPYLYDWEDELILKFKTIQVFTHAPEVFSLTKFALFLMSQSEGMNPPSDYGLTIEDFFERYIRQVYAVRGEEVCLFERPALNDDRLPYWYRDLVLRSRHKTWSGIFCVITELLIGSSPICFTRK